MKPHPTHHLDSNSSSSLVSHCSGRSCFSNGVDHEKIPAHTSPWNLDRTHIRCECTDSDRMGQLGDEPMSNAYQVVQWNPHKKTYDKIMFSIVGLYLVGFVGLGIILFPAPNDISPPVLLIRALGTCAIIMLHIILAIGPLARLTPRMNALLYNRRHLGVTFFCIALLHALLVVGFYGGFGNRNPISATLVGTYPDGPVPFEFIGFLALLIFAILATTSHDFWLANLGPRCWKLMHMGVYIAYALVLGHVIFGVLETEQSIVFPLLLTLGALMIVTLHITVGVREVRKDRQSIQSDSTQWVNVCSVDDIESDRAKIIQINNDERIAIFKHNNSFSAISNVCAHQGGPLGEGKVVDGCVTCPWHGYQYLPDCGQSPPPFTEKIPTYDIKVEGKHIFIDPTPKPPGTPIAPAKEHHTEKEQE